MLVHGHKRCQTFPRCLQTPWMTAFHWRTVFWHLSFSASKEFQVAPPRGATCPTFFLFLLFRLHCCNIRMCNLIFWALGFAHVIACCGMSIWCFTYTHAQKYCGWHASSKKRRSFVVQCLTVGRNLLSWSCRRLVQATELPCLEVSKMCIASMWALGLPL